MMIRALVFIIFPVYIILFVAVADSLATCNRSCGAYSVKDFPFPFGFSSGCPIRLNCSANGTAVIGEFPVQTINSDSILVNLPAKCGRPIQSLQPLFTQNFAPTSVNGILLQNCDSPVTGCFIPNTTVQTHFQLLNCTGPNNGESNNISCYSEQNKESKFMDYSNLTKSGCKSLLSAISVVSSGNTQAVSLDVQVVNLGWWLEGPCLCSEHANCTPVSPPIAEGQGYRCQCLEGFAGDGYQVGLGCRKASSTCHPAEFLAGQCGSTSTRIGLLVGGIAAGACLMISVGLICCHIKRGPILKNRKRTKKGCLSEARGITIPIYSSGEIERATNFFSPKQQLGTGAYGTVYSGKLNNEEWVAIKRIKHRDSNSTEQVLNEINLLSSVNHPNLVRLLGCSIENGEQILVYEFMPNGTLSQHLQRERRSDGLSWPVRLSIATETAQAIAYLHSTMSPPIYHRDIKSSNILLDYNFKSKVADFGLSRLGMTESSHISTAPQGTPGYLDPQYHQNFHLSDKSDVYSFGVVLVEIITGLKAVDFTRPQNEVNLAALAMDRIGKGHLDEIIDPSVAPREEDGWTLSSLHKVAEMAFRCLAYDRDLRPSMKEVAIELEQIRLSRLASASSEGKITASSEASYGCSLSSNVSEKPLSVKELISPVSVQEPWLSEHSSPSSNSLLGHAVQ